MTLPIRTLADDEKITEPGFYQISMDRHHNQPCDGPSVTSGILRKMELETPADVWAFHKLNPDRWPDEDRPALWLGRAMAAYVEGGMDEVAKHFLVMPDDAPHRPTATQIKAFETNGFWSESARPRAEFWDKIDADPRTPLKDGEITMIKNMGTALAADPAATVVMSGVPEITMAYQCERTGIWVLARPDTVSFDGTLSDYKKMNTMGSPFSHRLVDQRITKHGYDMQMGLAATAFQRLTGEWPSIVSIVAQWDKPPHHVIPREISEEDLTFGQFRNERAILRFSECLASGHWPGPAEDVGAYQRPEWQRNQILEEMQMEGKAP